MTEEEGRSRLGGVKVLAVDDELDTRVLVTIALSQAGANVEVATSAAEALQIINRGEVGLVLCDIGMPAMDGYSLVATLRQQERERACGTRLPAAALTAYATPRDRQRAFDSGFDAYITKPCPLSELVDVVARLVGRGEQPVCDC